MARGLTSAVKTELATGNIRPVFLLKINTPTPVYLTNCGFPLTSSVTGSSETYLASGHLKSISQNTETNTPNKNTIVIGISGVEQTYVAVALTTNVINTEVHIYRGFLNSSNTLIADPFLLYFGTIDKFGVSDNTTTASVSLTVTSHWGNFDKISGRTTTDNSQQRFFSGDKGMEFAALTVRDLKWGRI